MNALMNPGAPLTMSSQEIADLVESRHDKVKQSIERLAARCVIQLPPMGEVRNHLGQAVSVYQLCKRDTYVVVAQLSPEFTARLVDRWQELESQQSNAIALPDFTNPAEAARAWALEFEEKQKAQAALAIAAPKVDFFDKVVDRKTLMTATQVGQKVGLSAIKLNQAPDAFSVFNKGVKRGRVFQQWFVDKGYGELKQTELGYSQPLFTTAGEAWIVEKLTGEGVI